MFVDREFELASMEAAWHSEPGRATDNRLARASAPRRRLRRPGHAGSRLSRDRRTRPYKQHA